ncbi:hypothetical protein AB4538_21695 [Vibrio lentus]
MKKIILFVAVILSPLASAKWLSTDKTDEITGERTLSAFSYEYGQDEYIGIRCDVSNDSKKVMLTFDVDAALGTPRTEVDLFVKVDDNQPVSLRGRLFTNSYRSGYVRSNDKTELDISKLIAQMISGKKAYVKVQNDRRSEVINFNVGLSGFTAKTKKLLSLCSFKPVAKEMSVEDKARLKDIADQFEKLQLEKDAILSKY